jgi:hypothetical protein
MPDKSPEEKAEYVFEIRREEAIRAHDGEQDFWKQTNQAAIDSGSLAIKTAFLINGGAAVAMLTFIGGLVGQGRIGDTDLHSLSNSLMWFAAGVAFAAASTGAAYFTNFYTAASSSSKPRVWEHPYLGKPEKKWVCLRMLFLYIAVLSGAASLGLFVAGMYKVKTAVENIKIVAPLGEKTSTGK